MDLLPAERMNLLKFVCSFVWTDLRVDQAERDLVMRIVGHLHLTDDEMEQVKQWLAVPPPEDEVDPTEVPRAHRELFLEAAKLAVEADGRVVPAERDSLGIFRDLLRSPA
ncbi:MAG TPA: TerB family tellurite resistance protein [Planctomycetota bacterium]